ncbi:Hypothetical protein, putative [Bodo saltans]|uniref:Leucine-rich repeat protein n=1 Tax=Bodo saltans TaxID=75058 RepID=A0A0S4JAI5_BODSA|nr:Hypothetical protein, putative [Bodo saltans]|eukprot:CUG87260.1 Hypothetical protein, putative [Bodo saltans]
MPPLTAPSSTARSGRWLASPITNAPVGVDSYIAGKHRGAASPAASPINGGGGSGLTGGFEISSVMVGHIFSLHPKQLALDRCRFAAGAFEALAQEVARSTTLTALSIAGCTGVPASSSIGSEVLHLLWNALLENTTLEALDVSNVQLTENDANFLADNVIPWNRSIVEWNLSGNPDLSDGGVTRIIGALVSAASSVERINLRRCGMGMDGLINVLLELRSLTSLQQLDVAMNGGYHQPQVMDVMREVDEILHRNCKLMHPSGSLSHTALYDATAVEMREQSEGGGFSEFTSIGADVLAFSASNVAGLGNPIKRRESIRLQQMPSPAAKQLERRSSLLLRSPDKHSAAGSGGSAPSPTMRSSASFRNGPRHTVAGTSNVAIAAAAAAYSGEQPHKKQHVDPQVGGTTGVVRRSSVATMPQSTPPSAFFFCCCCCCGIGGCNKTST